ncbi:hypothetical protein [Bacillus solimangrovi]|nr:hypothetical protein [Bacillus solimangrovi]
MATSQLARLLKVFSQTFDCRLAVQSCQEKEDEKSQQILTKLTTSKLF